MLQQLFEIPLVDLDIYNFLDIVTESNHLEGIIVKINLKSSTREIIKHKIKTAAYAFNLSLQTDQHMLYVGKLRIEPWFPAEEVSLWCWT